jgi:ABC-type lipoprotein release transport system permease subunit
MAATLPMALRNLLRRRGRYSILGIAMTLGCAIMTTVAGSLQGMRSSLQDKAALYYGGDFSLHGLRKDGLERIPDTALALKALGGRDEGLIVSPRIVDRESSSFLFFAGASIQLKMITGVDWKAEASSFERLNFISGGVRGIGENSGQGIIISEPMAEALGARVGDDLLVLGDTVTGQRNTATAVLRGIFRDSSFLGADTAYVGIDYLRSLMQYPEGATTEIGVKFARPGVAAKQVAEVQRRLEGSLPMFALASSRDELFKMQADQDWQGQRYAILSLKAHVRQIDQVVELMSIALYALVGILLGVVVLGIANTYRVIVYERRREIGTMRALGMQRLGVARLFLAEAGCLASLSSVLGIALALALLAIIGSLSFSWIPGFDVFLSHGRIAWYLSPGLLVTVVGIMLSTALLASWAPASRAAHIEPAAAYVME